MKTFQQDHILRKENGQPLGRAVLRFPDEYREGSPFLAALIKFPTVYDLSYSGLEVWVDGIKYVLPRSIEKSKIKVREGDHILSNIQLECAGHVYEERTEDN